MKKILLLAALTIFSACSHDSLHISCPILDPCMIDDNGEAVLLDEDSPDLEIFNVGECRYGLVDKCDGDNIICREYIIPADEVCDGLDNDCDGEVDEDYDLDNDTYTTCGGDCDDANELIYPGAPELCDGLDNNCDNIIPSNEIDDDLDTYSECEGDCDDTLALVNPGATEICNGIDDDCDGVVDEDEDTAIECGPENDQGICQIGAEMCVNGSESICVGAVYPQNEVCNNLDDDCDGDVDDALYQLCYTDCGEGIETCNSGNWTSCTAPMPSEELCDNGIDNDCDGEVDEGCPCNEGDIMGCAESPMYDINTGEEIVPACGMGIKICDIYGEYGPCYFFNILPEECNSWDDDCDGDIDGITDYCSSDPEHAGVGECTAGLKECTNGVWSSCEDEIFPEPEVCDGLDNDCDGLIDEDLDPHNKVDLLFVIDISGSMQPYINALANALSLYAADFSSTDHKFGLVVFPGNSGYGSWNELSIRSGVSGNAFIDVGTFQSLISSLAANGGPYEPSYDVAHILMNPIDPRHVGWRSDAYPYIILITDEPAQTWAANNNDAMDVASHSLDCQVGSCQPGSAYEFYVISKSNYSYQWEPALSSTDNYKFLPYSSSDMTAYINILRDIFKNACM